MIRLFRFFALFRFYSSFCFVFNFIRSSIKNRSTFSYRFVLFVNPGHNEEKKKEGKIVSGCENN